MTLGKIPIGHDDRVQLRGAHLQNGLFSYVGSYLSRDRICHIGESAHLDNFGGAGDLESKRDEIDV